MISPHTLSFRLLLSSLTGLVLLAFAAACPELRLNNHKAAVAVEASSHASKFGDRTPSERGSVIAATADLDVDDEEPLRSASFASSNADYERIAFALAFLSAHCAPVPTHRSCASPPTGPPHA